MALTTEEGKARRRAGMERAKQELTAVQRIQRALINGRPPASELRTPLSAVTAARTLHRDLEARTKAEGLTPAPGDLEVRVAYVTPDLSVLGFTLPFAPSEEAGMTEMLTGNIALGLTFGIADPEARDEDSRIVVGSRPFLVTKQTDAWLSELVPLVKLEMKLS
jgi:hypothetical protein